MILMQDNASPHTAKVTKTFLRTKGVKVLDKWPAHSPDLNPIEDIWAIMKPKVRKLKPRTINDLGAAIHEVYGKLSSDVF